MRLVRFLQIAGLILIAAGAQPAYSAFYQWSKTSATNSGADPTINWAEGMSPSSVNDSGRAMMARAAEYRDDISGLLTTGGSSTAYTVATNQGLASTPNDGQLLAITMSATNGASATLTADSGTAFPIQSSAGVAVGSGTMISGSPYTLRFSVANSAWMLRDFYSSPVNIPLGALLPYTGTTAPNSNFILPAGQCISTSTYASYWALMGSPASGACPGGQFAVVDLRGRIPAALDNLGGSAASRMTSAAGGCGTAMTSVGTTCANGSESHTLTTAQLAAHTHANSLNDPGHTHSHNANVTGAGSTTPGGGFSIPGIGTATINAAVTGMTITNASSGSGTAFPVIPPTMAFTYIMRVL